MIVKFQASSTQNPRRMCSLRSFGMLTAVFTIMMGMQPLATPTRASEVPSLGLYGNDDVLWIFQRKPDKSGTLHLHFSFWLMGESTQDSFFLPHIQGLTGGIAKAALRGTALHAIYRDGSHWRYNTEVFSRLPTARPMRVSQRDIPGKTIPIAMGVDQSKSILYAVITARQARELIKVQLEASAISDELNRDDTLVSNEQTPKATVHPEITTDYVIIRFQQGRWQFDRLAPSDLTLGSAVPSIVGDDGVVHLVYRDAASPLEYRYRKSEPASKVWTSSWPITFDAPLACMTMSLSEPAPIFVASLEKDRGIEVAIYRIEHGHWVLSKTLSDSAGHVRHFAQPVAAAIFSDTLAMATQDAEQVVSVGRWSLESGLPIESERTVKSLQFSRLTTPESHVRSLIQYGILGSILIVVFLRRRESVLLVASIKNNQQLASFAHRIAAFLIDMSVLFPVWGSLLYQQRVAIDRIAHGGLSNPNQLVFWLPAVIGAIFGGYCLIFESIIGATLGKRVLGLSVVTSQGERGNISAILIRNLVRPIEFYFPPVSMLVMVTPSRQRFGDLLARTVVVMPKGPTHDLDVDSNQDDDASSRFDEQA